MAASSAVEREPDLRQLVTQPKQSPLAHRSRRSMRSRNARLASSFDVSTPYMAIHVVRANGWHTARSVRVTVRLPVSPSSVLTSLDDRAW